jgi:hypothetical protein
MVVSSFASFTGQAWPDFVAVNSKPARYLKTATRLTAAIAIDLGIVVRSVTGIVLMIIAMVLWRIGLVVASKAIFGNKPAFLICG